jgi:hypothetical protein
MWTDLSVQEEAELSLASGDLCGAKLLVEIEVRGLTKRV